MQIDTVNSRVRSRSAYSVLIDGADYTSSFMANSATHDAGTSFASAQLQVAQPITLTAGRHTMTIYAGWNGLADMVMKGEISTTQQTLWQPGQNFSVGGFLRRTNDKLTTAYAYGTTADSYAAAVDLAIEGYTPVDLTGDPTDAAIIVHILEHYGITPATTGHNIIASPRTIAALDPILWEPGMSGWQVISRLDDLSPNYRTADGRSGAVIRREIFGSVPAITRHSFVQGTDILGLELSEDIGTVVNEVIVRGAQDVSTGEQVEAIVPGTGYTSSVYIPTPPGVRTDESINDEWVETVAEAAAIGGDLLGRLSQPLATYTLTTFGCPDIDVGDGIRIESDLYTGNVFVAAHTISATQQAPFLQSVLQLRGSTSADVRTNQPPIPQMVISVILEQVYVSSTLTPLAMITIDATTSTDPDGTIASWTIVVDGQTYTGTDIATAIITRATTSASPLDVVLTVVDNGGLSASVTQAATWTTGTALQEPVALAEFNDGAATSDEVTWHTFAAAVTAVAPIALGDRTLYGCSDGKIYRSTDLLATAPTLVTTLPAGINCLWNNEKYTDRWLAGLSSGALYLSIDKGVTWTLLHTFPAAINDLTESPFAINDMLVASGTTLYHTYSGTAWDALYAWTSTLNRFASAQYGGQTVIYTGYASGDVVRHTDTGGTLLAGTMPGAHPITGLTLDRTQELVYVFNNQASGNAYSMTAGGTFTAGTDIGTAVNRAIRSGSGQWTYVASDGALVKWMNTGTQAYDIRRVTSPKRVLAVGYAALGTPVTTGGPIDFLLTSLGSGGPFYGVARYHASTHAYTYHNSGLPTGWDWVNVNASPSSTDHWLVLGQPHGISNHATFSESRSLAPLTFGLDHEQSPLWVTRNGGASFQEVLLYPPTEDVINYPDACFTPCGDTNLYFGFNRAGRIFATAQVWGMSPIFGGPTVALWHENTIGARACNAHDLVKTNQNLDGTYNTDLGTYTQPYGLTEGKDNEIFIPISTKGYSEPTSVSHIIVQDDATWVHIILFDYVDSVAQAQLINPGVFPGSRNLIMGLGPITTPASNYIGLSPDYRTYPIGNRFGIDAYPTSPMTYQGVVLAPRSILWSATAQQTLQGIWASDVTTLLNNTGGGGTLPTVAQMAGTAPYGVLELRSDRQTRHVAGGIVVSKTGVSLIGHDRIYLVYDGTGWTEVAGPAGSSGTNTAQHIEVINRT